MQLSLLAVKKKQPAVLPIGNTRPSVLATNGTELPAVFRQKEKSWCQLESSHSSAKKKRTKKNWRQHREL
jgi:hypothetical protein